MYFTVQSQGHIHVLHHRSEKEGLDIASLKHAISAQRPAWLQGEIHLHAVDISGQLPEEMLNHLTAQLDAVTVIEDAG